MMATELSPTCLEESFKKLTISSTPAYLSFLQSESSVDLLKDKLLQMMPKLSGEELLLSLLTLFRLTEPSSPQNTVEVLVSLLCTITSDFFTREGTGDFKSLFGEPLWVRQLLNSSDNKAFLQQCKFFAQNTLYVRRQLGFFKLVNPYFLSDDPLHPSNVKENSQFCEWHALCYWLFRFIAPSQPTLESALIAVKNWTEQEANAEKIAHTIERISYFCFTFFSQPKLPLEGLIHILSAKNLPLIARLELATKLLSAKFDKKVDCKDVIVLVNAIATVAKEIQEKGGVQKASLIKGVANLMELIWKLQWMYKVQLQPLQTLSQEVLDAFTAVGKSFGMKITLCKSYYCLIRAYVNVINVLGGQTVANLPNHASTKKNQNATRSKRSSTLFKDIVVAENKNSLLWEILRLFYKIKSTSPKNGALTLLAKLATTNNRSIDLALTRTWEEIRVVYRENECTIQIGKLHPLCDGIELIPLANLVYYPPSTKN